MRAADTHTHTHTQDNYNLVAWADWNVKCHVSNESVLAAVRRSSRQFSSLSRCGPKKFSTAESVLVSLSLRSEEVLDGRVSYRHSLAAASLHRPSRGDCLVSLSTLYGAGKVFFLPAHVSYGAGATASYQTLYLSDERYDHSK